MELAAPRLTFAIHRVEGPGPAVCPPRPGSHSETSAQAADAPRTDAVMVLPAREPGPAAGRGPGADELPHRQRRGGHGIAAHPVGCASCEHHAPAHHGARGVGL
ncbi:hypothetical protein ACFTY7_17925 [Streptomyces sp. NPDC057062]|uniref:hypothetical protein n=1 Tax=unclassified Streptomyces TaxID=2593676 RepID=UPI001C6E19E6|nr:hypothetical protein [Streptomyces sp. MBT84]